MTSVAHYFRTTGGGRFVCLRDMARTPSPLPVGESVHRHDEGILVRVWIVDGQGRDVEVDGLATAWSPRAVHVRYFDANGREGFVWVWASAVTRRRHEPHLAHER